MSNLFFATFVSIIGLFLLCVPTNGFSLSTSSSRRISSTISMAVNNDAFAKANRASRNAGGDDRTVEIYLPLGMDLDEDKDGTLLYA